MSQSDQGLRRSTRQRNLTPNGENFYEQTVQAFKSKLLNIKQELESNIAALKVPEIGSKYRQYCETSENFLRYLRGVRTNDSELEEISHQLVESALKSKIEIVLKAYETRHAEPPLFDSVNDNSSRSGSKASSQSHRSTSSTRSLLMRQRAKAEAAKVRLTFMEKEVELSKQQAAIQADMKLLASKRDLAEAEVELKCINDALDDSSQAESDLLPRSDTGACLKQERMEHYVNEQFENISRSRETSPYNVNDVDINTAHDDINNPKHSPLDQTQTGNVSTCQKLTPCLSGSASETNVLEATPRDTIPIRTPLPRVDFVNDMVNNTYEPHHLGSRYQHGISDVHQHPDLLNPHAASFSPARPDMYSDFTKFIVKKDLLLSRLTTFSDKPEFFDIWKTTFKSVMSELEVTPLEEMDLLVKWLGPESSKHALSIRAAHSNDPKRGLGCIWERLEERYASPELVEACLKAKLANFPKLTSKDNKRLYDLCDIVTEIDAVKNNEKYRNLLAYFDSSSGVIPIVNKLPHNLQDKWTNEAVKFKKRNAIPYPPFSVFVNFIKDMAKVKNDPSFSYEHTVTTNNAKMKKDGDSHRRSEHFVTSRKTDLDTAPLKKPDVKLCPLHKTNHTLNKCRSFRQKTIAERKEFLLANGICFKCCGPITHLAKDCKEVVRCELCNSSRHTSAMHVDNSSGSHHGGEKEKREDTVSSSCTQICGKYGIGSKSCAKTLLVKVFPEENPDMSFLTYAIIDDQSNRSLASSKFFNFFNERGEEMEYTLSSCSGYTTTSGRRANGYKIQSLDGIAELTLPLLTECNRIPDIREEIPTPEVANNYGHLQDITEHIPPMEPRADITLLIGRDLLAAHHVLDQRIGPQNSPYAQKLKLGWVIIGEACLGKVHQTDTLNVYKTHVLNDGRTTVMKPCPNRFQVRDSVIDAGIGSSVFQRTEQDDKPGLSFEDKQFLTVMESEFSKDSIGKWVAPLPFRQNRPRLPNNKSQALHRADVLDRSLRKNPTKMRHMLDFMQKVIDSGHAEIAPAVQNGEECWYLPLFGVYNPKKPNQIRGVFDASARFEGISLNSVLLTGPDLTNSLLGILMRFREGNIAVTGDIQQMFHCFSVREDHRNFLRFLWYRKNDPSSPMTEYRMTVHVFGNGPSPAVATFGLRKSVETADEDVRSFVEKNFYVDDGLLSTSSKQDAVDVMKRTQTALWDGGRLRLHKIASSSKEVLAEFPSDDLAKGIKDLDLSIDTPPTQRSLGLSWDLSRDAFTFQVSSDVKPFTRRGVLSTVNSLYDPIGFIAPVTVKGKLLLRDLMSTSADWDEPLPSEKEAEWCNWRDSLKRLENVSISRSYSNVPPDQVTRRELHVFSDASKEAIGAVSYLKVFDVNGQNHVSFVLGKAKVAPSHGHTIPRLELCAAVLAVELAQMVRDHLDFCLDSVQFYTDSKVVLGYISNERRRFYVYVGNRVDRIRHSTDPQQWHYVATDLNPADLATRSVPAGTIQHSVWLEGPSFLQGSEHLDTSDHPLVSPDQDKEVRPNVNACKTSVSSQNSLWTDRFKKFSSWKILVESIAYLQHLACGFQKSSGKCRGWHQCSNHKTVEAYRKAELFVLKEIQREHYGKELERLLEGDALPKNSTISSLSPRLDQNGILRVGGRLNKINDQLSGKDVNPIIIPKCYVSSLLVKHFHDNVRHQGRHFTEGAIRSAGYWLVGGKRIISSEIHKCVTCRRLRGKLEWQKMSDLPTDRLIPTPPFTHVGVDTFGPWPITTRKTRGGQANSKRWAILFTCLTTRAIHIEVVEELSSSSFINALRRFTSLRGPVKQFRSDRGTNFVGALDHLEIDSIQVEDGPVHDFIYDKGITWVFNPPHSSHMGGVWERMIGTSRRILDSLLLSHNGKSLTHEVLSTFMAEVCAIVNARPIVAVSSDPESPSVLSPAMLLTQKCGLASDSFGHLDIKDVYKYQWRHVQYLAETFWKRWQREYLDNLQKRQKWQHATPNLKEGDVVLMKDNQCGHRNNWPMGIILKTFPSDDGLVRKVQLRVSRRDGEPTTFVRPVSELILLVSE